MSRQYVSWAPSLPHTFDGVHVDEKGIFSKCIVKGGVVQTSRQMTCWRILEGRWHIVCIFPRRHICVRSTQVSLYRGMFMRFWFGSVHFVRSLERPYNKKCQTKDTSNLVLAFASFGRFPHQHLHSVWAELSINGETVLLGGKRMWLVPKECIKARKGVTNHFPRDENLQADHLPLKNCHGASHCYLS